MPAGEASAISVSSVGYKAATPWVPERLKATRSGSNIALVIYPKTQDDAGAGAQPADSYTDQAPPFPHDGDFVITYDINTIYSESTNVDITEAGSFTASVKHRVGGRLSPAKELFIDTTDGEYIS